MDLLGPSELLRAPTRRAGRLLIVPIRAFTLSMNAWLGAMGDRGFSTSAYTKTWGEYATGATTDRAILLFVR